MPTAIAFQSVTKRFSDGTLALDGATWSVGQGTRTCLLGPNGAGKSTSIRLLQGALRPTAGSVELLSSAINGPGYAEARRRCGIVSQNPGMYADLTAGEYLALAARLYGAGADRTVEAFGLGPYLGIRMTHLSEGFQRRLALAAALVAEPDVLLLDEPTVGLDPVAAHEVHGYLQSMMTGRSVLLCTHNLAEAEALCEDVVILRSGRVIVRGRLEDLRQHTQPRLRLTCHQGPDALRAALGDGARVTTDGAAVLVDVEDVEQEAPGLLRRLMAAGIDVYECMPIRATLEDLFLEAVQ